MGPLCSVSSGTGRGPLEVLEQVGEDLTARGKDGGYSYLVASLCH